MDVNQAVQSLHQMCRIDVQCAQNLQLHKKLYMYNCLQINFTFYLQLSIIEFTLNKYKGCKASYFNAKQNNYKILIYYMAHIIIIH